MKKEKGKKNRLERNDGISKIPIEIWLVTGMVSIATVIISVLSFRNYYYYGYGVGGIAIYFTAAIIGLVVSIRFIKEKGQKRNFWETSITKKVWENIEYTKGGYRNNQGKFLNFFLAKIILICLVIIAVGYQMIYSFYLSFFASIILIVLVILIFRIGADINIIGRAREELSKGNFEYRIDVDPIVWPLKKSANELNSIGEAIGLAVEEKLKSERLKTTLLTNVSHDIKTPLTSIINYANLMDKEKTKTKRMTEYIEVLLRQSNKLKRMTEDLIDASKASTGVMEVNLMEMDVETILAQAVGEYKEAIEEAGLEMILTATKEPAKIMCDDRLITRVLENLFSNICKYSLEGTRVYISSKVEEGRVYMSFKNISKIPLNITPEELKERFIRGDESRTEEGNGLGLNIADNFSNIQKGKLDIDIDGDLFKATISFDAI